MRGFRVFIAGFFISFVVGCASTATRLPAALRVKYNPKIVNSLTNAAVNRVLFQVDDSAFRDVPSRAIDQCRQREAPTWSKAFLNFLDLMDRNPELYEKFYMVEFKRGDRPTVEINQDIDGLDILILSYAKKERPEKITTATRMPCLEQPTEYLDKDLTITSIEWPNNNEIIDVLRRAPLRKKLDRFQFNTDFLVYLAEHQGVLKINPEVAFERNYRGEYFLSTWLETMAKQIATMDVHQDYLGYWLREISTHSAQAKTIQFFGLKPEGNPSVGVQVDTAGKLARKLNSFQEATYIFMSYRQHNDQYIFGSIDDLNRCLQSLTGAYRNPLSTGNALEPDPTSFLSPGYSCPINNEE